MSKKYINRLFDFTLEFTLKSKGAVLVEGPNGVVNQPLVKDLPGR